MEKRSSTVDIFCYTPVKQGEDNTPKEFKANPKPLDSINKTTLLLPQPIECVRLKETQKSKMVV